MGDWRKKRHSELAELTLVTHLVAYLIAIATLIINVPLEQYDFGTSALLLIGAVLPAAIIILLDYRFLQGEYTPRFIMGWNIIKYAGLFAVITAAYAAIQDERFWFFAAIYLLPVVLSCITLGQKWGMVYAGAAAGAIFLLSGDLTGGLAEQAFEAALIAGSVFLLLAWFLGGIIEVEKETTEKLSAMANEDSLTGLSNHRFFHERLNREMEKALQKQSELSLFLLDIDHFKRYNINFGYIQGDKLLKMVADLLREHTPSHVTLSRYSSNGFGVILPGANLQEANALAFHLCQVLKNYEFPGVIRQPEEGLTVSAGVAHYPEHAENAQELLEAADEALYSSKSTGRNKVRNYHSILEQLSKMAGDSDRELINSLRTLMTVVNGKDRYTYGHSERVAYYGKITGQAMRLNRQELRMLEIGAFLHDLGKIEIDREVLNKKGFLNNSEWNLVRQHPLWGAEILKPLRLLRPVIPMILHHHENYDGSGYPDGLKGGSIPLEARILRVVDSFDAMTTSRPYCRLFSTGEALKELEYYRGEWYDPQVVDIFKGILKQIDMAAQISN